MSSRFTASRHDSCSNRRIYIDPNKTKHSLVMSQEIVDQSESESEEDSEYSSDFGGSKSSSISFCTSELTERSNSLMNSSMHLGKGDRIMGKCNQQSSIHIHLRDKSKENSNSVKVDSVKNGVTQRNTLSSMGSLKININSTKNSNSNSNSSSSKISTGSSKSENQLSLSNKSAFQIIIKGQKDGVQQQYKDQVSLTKPKTKLPESMENLYCDENAYTNLKLKQKKDFQEGISDYLSTTAKQGTDNSCKFKKKIDSNRLIRSFNSEIIENHNNNRLGLSESLFAAPKNPLFTNGRSYKEPYLEGKQGNQVNDSISRLSQVNDAVQRRITRSQSEAQKYQNCLDCSEIQSSTKNRKNNHNNRNKKDIENDQIKKNGRRKKSYYDREDYVEDIEKSTDVRGKGFLEVSDEKQIEEACSSVQTSVTQFKQVEDTIGEDWKEGGFPKNMLLKRPFFLFDENESNNQPSKSNDETELNIWLRGNEDIREGQEQQRVTGEEKNWNVWKNNSRDQKDVSMQEINLKDLKQQQQNKKKLKKTAVQATTTTDYERIRYTSQLKDKTKFFEFNCFKDRDLHVPQQYMNKLQEITLDDDVMTDEETLTTYVEVCFTDLLEGIEMEQKHKEGVDHLWEYFNPPDLFANDNKRKY